MKKTKGNLKLGTKIIIAALAVSILGFATIGAFSYISYKNDMTTSIAKHALDLAETTSVSIDGDLVKKYDSTGEKDDKYQPLVDYLSRIKQLTGAKFVYIITDTGTEFKYIADGIVEGQTEEQSDLGGTDGYDMYGPEPKQVLASGISMASPIYNAGEYGDLISAFAPIKDSNGNITAVLGIDQNPKVIIDGISSYMLLLSAVVIGFIIITFVLLYFIIRRILTKRVKRLTRAAQALSNGEIGISLQEESKDEIGLLTSALRKVVSTTKALISDTDLLTEATAQGQLTTRVDTSRHQGYFKKIVEGMNSTLDGIVLPLEEFKSVLNRFSVNDYTSNVEGDYQGDLKEMADAIRGTHERLLSVQAVYVESATGDFNRLEMFKKIGRRSENDHMIPAIIKLMEGVNAAVDEANMLSNAVMLGQVDVRSDASRFEGRYRELIEGINGILDTMAKPLGETISIMNRMAENDYTMEMSTDYQGAFGTVSESINKVISTQNKVLHEINTAAMQVAAGTRQVSDGSQTLSQGATEQAASIEELTSTITEIAAQTRQNAANAAQANELAVAASSSAAKGNNQMKDMLGSMDEINESSTSISKIIKVIDDIAFQTNILALNAAVEAARAGAYGKGFAVVAEEVRNLAAKSAEAAKETTNLIEGSIKKVEQGTKYANATAGALGEILENAERVATLVAEIAVASNEQATGIAQVDKGIEQVATVVQGNSATAQESAAASEELSSQAEMLKGMVGQFKLKPTGQDAWKEPEKPKKDKTPALAGARFGKY